MKINNFLLISTSLLLIPFSYANQTGYKKANATSFFSDKSEALTVTLSGETYLISGFGSESDKDKIRVTDKIKLDGLSFEFYINNPSDIVGGQMAGFYFGNEENYDVSVEREIATTQYSLWSNKNAGQDRFAIYQHVIDSFDFISGGTTYPQYGNQIYYVNKTNWKAGYGFSPNIPCEELVMNHAPNGKSNYLLGLKFIFSKFSEHIYEIKIIEKEPNTIWVDNNNYSNDGNGFFVTTYIDDYYLPLDDNGDTYLYFYGYNANSATPPTIKLTNFYNPNSLTRKVTYRYVSNIASVVKDDTVIEVSRGSLLTKPSDPTLEGYQFAGWYKDLFYTYAWNYEVETVESNVTLYARWVKNGEEIPPLVYETNKEEEKKDDKEEDSSEEDTTNKTLVKKVYKIDWALFSIIIILGIIGIIALGIGGYFLIRYLILIKKRRDILNEK